MNYLLSASILLTVFASSISFAQSQALPKAADAAGNNVLPEYYYVSSEGVRCSKSESAGCDIPDVKLSGLVGPGGVRLIKSKDYPVDQREFIFSIRSDRAVKWDDVAEVARMIAVAFGGTARVKTEPLSRSYDASLAAAGAGLVGKNKYEVRHVGQLALRALYPGGAQKFKDYRLESETFSGRENITFCSYAAPNGKDWPYWASFFRSEQPDRLADDYIKSKNQVEIDMVMTRCPVSVPHLMLRVGLSKQQAKSIYLKMPEADRKSFPLLTGGDFEKSVLSQDDLSDEDLKREFGAFAPFVRFGLLMNKVGEALPGGNSSRGSYESPSDVAQAERDRKDEEWRKAKQKASCQMLYFGLNDMKTFWDC